MKPVYIILILSSYCFLYMNAIHVYDVTAIRSIKSILERASLRASGFLTHIIFDECLMNDERQLTNKAELLTSALIKPLNNTTRSPTVNIVL